MKKFSRREFLPLAGLTLLSASCLSAKPDDSWLGEPLMIRPRKLKKGDTIGVCAPAGAIKHQSEISEFTSVLNGLGFKVKLGKHVSERFGYFSATDEERADEFMSLIEDPEVNGIFSIRGGWGCARILEHLDFELIERNPKVIMGFSDLTTLLLAITEKTKLVTFHGPGGNSSWNDYSVNYIRKVLMQAENVHFENGHNDLAIHTLSSGEAMGEFYGGNLTVMSGLIGSDYLPDWQGKILFLEDVLEEPYSIDRMLTQLKLNGIFNQVAGVVLGTFRKCVPEEPEYSFTLKEVFEQHFKDVNFPVFSGAQFGHTKNKFTFPVGTKVTINADNGTVKMMEPGVV